MKVVLVDDEPIARRVLREGLDFVPEVRIVGEAADGKEALDKIRKLQPDLVFLDVQMPVMSGFEVAQNLVGPNLPIIVIVTAFDLRTIEALHASEIDYLLKPVSDARLRATVEYAQKLMDSPGKIAERVSRIAYVQGLGAFSKSRI